MFPPPPLIHPTQDLVDQGVTQGSETGKAGVFTDTEEYRGCRECFVLPPVTTKEGVINIRSICMGIDYQLTQIRSHNIMGYWRTWKV